jgi:hypothetical protein
MPDLNRAESFGWRCRAVAVALAVVCAMTTSAQTIKEGKTSSGIVFECPPASRPLVRQMVIDAERLWTVDRKLKGPPQTAIDRLESVKAPALILIGDRDEALNFTSPNEFNAAVRDFLGMR